MAQRGLSALMLAELAKNSIEYAFLVDMNLSTPIYLTNTYKNLTWNSNTYVSGGDLISIGSVTESIVPTVGSCALGVSGVNQDNLATALLEDFINVQVTIRIALLRTNGDLPVVIENPLIYMDGRIDSFEFNEDITSNTASLVWNLTGYWGDFDKVAGRRGNHNDQQIHYPGDDGYEFAAQIIRDIKWGRV